MATMKGTKTKPAFCSHSVVVTPSDGRCLRIAAEPAEDAGRDRQRHHELHDADAEIAEAGIDGERVALLRLREEEGDVGHRGGEVAAAEAAEQRQRQEDPVGRIGVLHRKAHAERRDQQRPRGERRPQPAAEDGRHEGVEDAQRRAGEAGQRRQPEELLGGEREADARQLGDDDRPDHPDREGQQQAGN